MKKNNKTKKIMALTLSTCILVNIATLTVNAAELQDENSSEVSFLDKSKDYVKVALTSAVIGSVPMTIKSAAEFAYKYLKDKIEVRLNEKYIGFNSLRESKNALDKVSNGTSAIKIYGQDKAKKQCMPIVMESMYNIHCIKNGTEQGREKPGNVIYMIGPSGVGKTTMAKAIAKAVLRHPEKTCILVDTSAIDNSDVLGNQLFKSVEIKTIGKAKREKLGYDNGISIREEEAPILDNIMNWYESVVIIDDYDKMKKMTPTQSFRQNYYSEPEEGNDSPKEDKSADEILKSIADTGKYRVSNTEVDCSKTLFIVTTNETKEELEKNFGIDGTKGGGAQRLNIIEFENLSFETCKKIIDDMVNEISTELKAPNGEFRLKSFNIDDESKLSLAQRIFDDKVRQGRLKRTIRREILSLFTSSIGEDAGKSFNVSYKSENSNNEEKVFVRMENR